jgi:hypothetical protein
MVPALRRKFLLDVMDAIRAQVGRNFFLSRILRLRRIIPLIIGEKSFKQFVSIFLF